MLKLLHFADAHIDMANYGRHDPVTGLPLRVTDFLKSLDTIVDAAIEEQVDLVIFAGDAYKDRNPAPTFQREWDSRMMRLSKAEIPTVLLVGNHDMSPGFQRAHALEELKTLEVPCLHVVDRPNFLSPAELGLPVQVLALPWITRSGMVAFLDMPLSDPQEVFDQLEERISALIEEWLSKADPDLPVILTAHATIQGAAYGDERRVMLGNDLVLSPALVKDQRLDYVALGHIHKPQDLNEGGQPPVVYPGSIERVDFGEAKDEKFFVITEVEKGAAELQWRQLSGIRPFIDRSLHLDSDEDVSRQLIEALPSPDEMQDAILRLTLEYPRAWEALIDEAALREAAANTFEFHLVKRPQMEARVRIPADKNVGSLRPEELLEIYWKSTHTDPEDRVKLLGIAKQVIASLAEPDEDAPSKQS